MNFDDFIFQARAKEHFRSLGRRATQDEIDTIEKRLKITLPDTYKQLVQDFGHVRWFGNAIFGIDPEEEEDTVSRTVSERESLAKYPGQFGQVLKDGNIIAEIFGGGYCFLYSMESRRAGQVSAHAPDERYQEVQYWHSLEDYFEYLINGTRNWRAVAA